MKIYNQQILKDRRRELPSHATPAEKMLWARIRNGQLHGFKFFRQFGAGPYILDFYCPKGRLAIELDGSPHKESDSRVYDEERKLYLEGLGIRTIRFWNRKVIEDIDNVIMKITFALPLKPKRELEGVVEVDAK